MIKCEHLAIVGLGSIGKKHLSVLKKVRPNIKITAVRSDIKKTKINNKLIDNQVTNIQEAINSGIQGAIICSPASLHLKQSLEFAKNNINIFVEKPISNSLKNINKLLNIVKKNRLINKVGYVYKFDKSAKKFKNIIDGNILGKITGVNIQCGSYLPNWRKNQNYKESASSQEKLGGGVLLELSHEIDYVLWFFGNIKEVYAKLNNSKTLGIDVEDNANLILVSKKGLNISISLNFNQIFPNRVCVVQGTKGEMTWDLYNSKIFIKKINQKTKILKFSKNDNSKYEFEIKNFIECIEGKKSRTNSFKEAIKTLKIVEFAKLSNRKGKNIVIL